MTREQWIPIVAAIAVGSRAFIDTTDGTLKIEHPKAETYSYRVIGTDMHPVQAHGETAEHALYAIADTLAKARYVRTRKAVAS